MRYVRNDFVTNLKNGLAKYWCININQETIYVTS